MTHFYQDTRSYSTINIISLVIINMRDVLSNVSAF